MNFGSVPILGKCLQLGDIQISYCPLLKVTGIISDHFSRALHCFGECISFDKLFNVDVLLMICGCLIKE